MHRFMTSRPWRFASLRLRPMPLYARIGGCTYPTDWPALANQQSAHSCSDLRGTFVFDDFHGDYGATTFSVLSAFIAARVPQVYNARLLLLVIASDAETMLTATFTSARSALATDLDSAPEPQSVTAQY